jgi:transposase-like protein
MHPEFKKKPKVCPRCQSTALKDVYVGLPPEDIMKLAEMKTSAVTIVGCFFDSQNPSWVCQSCGYKLFKS